MEMIYYLHFSFTNVFNAAFYVNIGILGLLKLLKTIIIYRRVIWVGVKYILH